MVTHRGVEIQEIVITPATPVLGVLYLTTLVTNRGFQNQEIVIAPATPVLVVLYLDTLVTHRGVQIQEIVIAPATPVLGVLFHPGHSPRSRDPRDCDCSCSSCSRRVASPPLFALSAASRRVRRNSDLHTKKFKNARCHFLLLKKRNFIFDLDVGLWIVFGYALPL